jgi:DHA1 family bicyclomycin/chloramphenicol resistance-like MFS transporter
MARVTQTPQSQARLVLVLGSLIAIGPLTIDMYLPALPSITTGLATTPAAVQLTLAGTLAGLAVGQLAIGPLSDAVGRRLPLLAGLLLHVAASVACVFAPDVLVLGGLRVLQGLGVAASAVVAMAVVRDLFDGAAFARLFSRLMLVMGAAPILAPTLGGAVLRWTDWRGVFVTLAIFGVVLCLVAGFALPETLPPHRRRSGGTMRVYAGLLRDRTFMGLVLVAGLAMASLFGYVAGSSFVYQDEFGLSEQEFALAFGAGAVGLIAATQFNVRLLRRFTPQRILVGALLAGTAAGLVLLGLALAHLGGLPAILASLWAVLAAAGLALPNAPALAMSRHGEAAGTAAALLGAVQFGVGAAAAPLVGLLGTGAVAMAIVVAGGMVLAAVALLAVVRPSRLAAIETSGAEPVAAGAHSARGCDGSSAAGGGVVLVDDLLLDAAAIGNLETGALRPFPDGPVLVAVPARRAASPAGGGSGPNGRAAANLAARGNIGLQRGAQFLGVLLRQIDRILHTVETERDALIGGLAVQIVDQFLNDTLGHDGLPPASDWNKTSERNVRGESDGNSIANPSIQHQIAEQNSCSPIVSVQLRGTRARLLWVYAVAMRAPAVDWGRLLVSQLEFYWDIHLWPRLNGLNDDEYFWEPVAGCWSIRADADGRFRSDPPPGPAATGQPPPVTTIAWRMMHVAVGCFATRTSTFFGDGSGPADADMFDPRHTPADLPHTASDGVAFLHDSYQQWHDHIAALDDEGMRTPLGPKGAYFSADPMAALIVHVNRETMHHGGEIGVLRDLYRALPASGGLRPAS